MNRLTRKEVQDRFDEARALIARSQRLQDKDMLSEGTLVLRAALEDCRRIDAGARLSETCAREIYSAIDFSGAIEACRGKKEKRDYLSRLLYDFKPTVGDITGKRHNQEIDTLLVKGLIRHDSGHGWNNYALKTFDFNALLSHFGSKGSRAAFALVLDECLRRFKELNQGGRQPLNVRILPLLNAFKQPDVTKPALPVEILKIIADRPFQILAEHRKYKREPSGGFLNMGVLQAILDHCPSNEAVMDVVLELVGNSLYEMNNPRQLIWAEQLGVTIDTANVGQKLRTHAPEDHRVAALHYLLASPHVSVEDLSTIFEQTPKGFESNVAMLTLSALIDPPDGDSKTNGLLTDKVVKLIRYLFETDRKTAVRIMGLKWFPPRVFMADPVLRDHLMAADLGL